MTTLVAGIDSSTQSCKVVVYRLGDGQVVREGKAEHPAGTIVDPDAWWDALLLAVRHAGGLEDVAAISVSGQQHTPVLIGSDGGRVRNSPLWNDLGSHPQVRTLNDELGHREWIRRTGLPITLSDTVVKLRWLRDTDAASLTRTAAVALVHDWLTWRLQGGGPGQPTFDRLVTDRSEASGTGYWSGETGQYCDDLIQLAAGRTFRIPTVLGPNARAGVTAAGIAGIPAGVPLGVGSGDNAAAALALNLQVGDAAMSLGTSGVVYARSPIPVHDYSGVVCSYADATGDHLPIAVTLNAARNLDAATSLLECDHERLSDLALAAPPGACGLTVLPYFEGERTPDLPTARASFHGASLGNFTRENFARAMIEGTLASQSIAVDAIRACGVRIDRLLLIGGAAQSRAAQRILPEIVDTAITVPEPGEYVARGAAMQAGAALTGQLPGWRPKLTSVPRVPIAPVILEQHETAKAALGYPTTKSKGR